MTDLYERDPEEVGPEHPDDLKARMDFIEARHEFETSPLGYNCIVPVRRFCYTHNEVDDHNPCNLPRSSVMHFNDFLDYHDHGGGDCMCFEGRYDG